MDGVDFDALQDAIYSHKCKVENCERKVSVRNALCQGCFMGLITGEVVRMPDGRRVRVKEEG